MISDEIKLKTYSILLKCKPNQLLWILERYFNRLYANNYTMYNPCVSYYQHGLQKQTPPGAFSDIIVMEVEMDTKEEKTEYNKYIINSCISLINDNL